MSQYEQAQAHSSFSHAWTAGRSRPLIPPDGRTAPSLGRSHVQKAKEPAVTWQLMADHSDHAGNDGAPPGTLSNLSFYQRHFTRPIIINPDKPHRNASDRSFSLRSRGFLIVALIMVLILLGIIGAAVGVSLAHPARHRHEADAKHLSPVRLVLAENFPDPALYFHDKTWYAYATNNAAGILQRPKDAPSDGYGVSNIQVATSTNFLNWTLLDSAKDPLPDIAAWALHGHDNRTNPPIPRANVWAPSITKQPSDNGSYIMYYAAARNKVPHPGEKSESPQLAKEPAPLPHHPVPHCIGAATASTPLGPFNPVPTPIACPIDAGGAIDAAAFVDHDSTPYVLYKVDGNNIGNGGSCGNMVKPRAATPIMLQKLKPDMLTPDGPPDMLLDRTNADGPLVEAPELVRSSEGIYFLFFSSGCTREPSYDLKYATATDIKGPYTRADEALLQTGDWDLHAPGSAGLFPDGKDRFNLVFHARVLSKQGRVRAMFAGKLELKGRKARFVEPGHE